MDALTFEAITTFEADAASSYGARMMSSYARHWPRSVNLTVYGSGDLLRAEVERNGHRFRDIYTASDWLEAFKKRHADRRSTSYRYDAVRFSHKVAAVTHAGRLPTQGTTRYLIWIDSDVITHADITLRDLHLLAPTDGAWISWLPRVNVYPECGFYILDRYHTYHTTAIQRLRDLYAHDGLFELQEQHDSFVLEHVVRSMDIKHKSLSGKEGVRTMHPFINGPLGAFMDHLKGNRKSMKRSPLSDLVVKRTEAHWQ